jgi:hypothetical protein
MVSLLAGPPGYERVSCDVAWDPAYLELVPPERVTLLDEWGPGAAGPAALSPVAITSPFRFLGDEGVRILQEICAELKLSATGHERIAKRTRGGIYRSEFLAGMVAEPALVDFLGDLAQVPLVPHPISHHAVHVNYAPDELERNVDQWHRDAVAFDFVLMVSDPRPMKGGRFEYFLGPVEEGRELLAAGGLPPERVAAPEFPGPGWAVFQQGHRVLHRAARLEQRYERTTMVCSYHALHAELPDPTDLATILKADGREIALVEWARYAALVAAGKLERFAATKTDFSLSHDELKEELRASVADVADALEAFEREDDGRLIQFESQA